MTASRTKTGLDGSPSERAVPEVGHSVETNSVEGLRKETGPGSGGRTVNTCLKTVRRGWPHLQWWRAVADNGQVEEEQQSYLFDAGFETETVDDDTVVIKSLTES